MERTTRPLSLERFAWPGRRPRPDVVGHGQARRGATPAAISGPFQLTDQAGQAVTDKSMQGATLAGLLQLHPLSMSVRRRCLNFRSAEGVGKDADRVNAYISVEPRTRSRDEGYLSSFDPRLKGHRQPEEIAGFSEYQVYAKSSDKAATTPWTIQLIHRWTT